MSQGPGAEGTEVAESVLGAVGDKYAARILAAAAEPRSAQQLSDELDVPIATCYRRIDDLVAADLLVCVGRQTSDRGRRTKVYRRTVDGLAVDLRGGEPELSLEAGADLPDPDSEAPEN